MGKQVKVRYLGGCGPNPYAQRDCTVGKIYDAILYNRGDRCHEGALVDVDDGIRLLADDVGDVVSTALQWGFEIVEEAV